MLNIFVSDFCNEQRHADRQTDRQAYKMVQQCFQFTTWKDLLFSEQGLEGEDSTDNGISMVNHHNWKFPRSRKNTINPLQSEQSEIKIFTGVIIVHNYNQSNYIRTHKQSLRLIRTNNPNADNENNHCDYTVKVCFTSKMKKNWLNE